MEFRRLYISLWTAILTIAVSAQAQSGSTSSPVIAAAKPSESKIIVKSLPFPSPVQWRLNADNRSADISLTGVAWGPADAPEMIAKVSEQYPNEKPEQFSDRSYVIALSFRARMSTPLLDMRTRSGLVRIKDADGNTEPPWDVTSSGLVQKNYDIHFAMGNVSAQYWDFFPVPREQNEFLFEVHSPAQSVLYFRVIRKDGDFEIINSTPDAQSNCLQFEKSFGGSIGADCVVSLQIARQKELLSGTERYAKTGNAAGLTGVVDSLGNFMIEERYPKSVSGIFKGKFDVGYQTMSGYFSKPDGSDLQPFEFHELQPTNAQGQGREQAPSQPNYESNGSAVVPPHR